MQVFSHIHEVSSRTRFPGYSQLWHFRGLYANHDRPITTRTPRKKSSGSADRVTYLYRVTRSLRMRVALIRLKAHHCHLRVASVTWLITLSDMCDHKMYLKAPYKLMRQRNAFSREIPLFQSRFFHIYGYERISIVLIEIEFLFYLILLTVFHLNEELWIK